jgi:hypothetical protein
MPSEAQARIIINRMLEEASWRFLPDAQGRRENIICEHRVTRRAFSPSQELGKDFERAPQGFVDYVMLHTDQRPVAVTEAKRESIDPLTGKEQARGYAEGLGVSHIFLSNGLVHYYWFDEEFDYDQKLTLPKGPPEEGGEGGVGGGGIRTDDFANTSPDPITSVVRDEVGLFGMRIDREMYRERFAQQAGEAVASDTLLREAYEAENWPAVEERVRRLLCEKPGEFWNLPKLQELYKTDRRPNLREILARVFGLVPCISTRGQLAEEAFERFIATQETDATHSRCH